MVRGGVSKKVDFLENRFLGSANVESLCPLLCAALTKMQYTDPWNYMPDVSYDLYPRPEGYFFNEGTPAKILSLQEALRELNLSPVVYCHQQPGTQNMYYTPADPRYYL